MRNSKHKVKNRTGVMEEEGKSRLLKDRKQLSDSRQGDHNCQTGMRITTLRQQARTGLTRVRQQAWGSPPSDSRHGDQSSWVLHIKTWKVHNSEGYTKKCFRKTLF